MVQGNIFNLIIAYKNNLKYISIYIYVCVCVCVCVCVKLNHLSVYQKLTRHCKSNFTSIKKKKKSGIRLLKIAECVWATKVHMLAEFR